MAAVTELSFLLFALINYIHAGERLIVRQERDSHTFNLPYNTDSCLISRSVGEEKLVLWNTNNKVPEHLKRRLVSKGETSSYTILHLTHSDSGPYREECWTEGNAMHDNNFTIIVCTNSIDWRFIRAKLGETAFLPCVGAADNLDVQWVKVDNRYVTYSRVLGDNTTSVKDNVGGRYQMVTNTSALRVSNVIATDITNYICLVMNQQQCVSGHALQVFLQYEMIYGSVGESAVLPCNAADSTDEHPPRWSNQIHADLELQNQTGHSVDQNYSLVFSSLMLNHSGRYYCDASTRRQQVYVLVVCPQFGPPAVVLFSEGEDVTLGCKERGEGKDHDWFIKSHRTKGRIFSLMYQRMSGVSMRNDGSLVISNISGGDAGEYWCAIIDPDSYQCESTVRTLLVYNEPKGI